MNKYKINVETPDYLRKRVIQFIINYGDGHITKKAIKWLQNTPFSKLNDKDGDLIHVYLDARNRLLGVIAIAKFGLEQAIIVVHPRLRKKGVAHQLTTGVLGDIDRYYVKVANDNIPSLKLCFLSGMQAFDLTKGPTGKPTLILGMGNWNSDEWKGYEKIKK